MMSHGTKLCISIQQGNCEVGPHYYRPKYKLIKNEIKKSHGFGINVAMWFCMKDLVFDDETNTH